MYLKKRASLMRCLLLILAIAALLPLALVTTSSMTSEQWRDNISDVELGPMMCRIRNFETGYYLDAYKYTAKTAGKAYMAHYSESDSGQIFRIAETDNGTYKLIPQNNTADYVLSYPLACEVGSLIVEYKEKAENGNDEFDISKHENGTFIIAPSNGENPLAVLVQLDKASESNDPYAGISDINSSGNKHLWVIEPIVTEKLTTTYSQTKVKLYTTGRFYARKYPYNFYTDDIVWSSDNENVLLVGEDGIWCALSVGTAVVTATVDSVSVSMKVTVSEKDAFTWYSQNNVYTSDWDATNLTGLRFSSGGYRKYFAVDDKAPGGSYCWMNTGCANCSVAMILHNMGAVKTNGFDLRSGQTGYLPADPYTVGLANSGCYGGENVDVVQYGNPVYMNWSYVAEQFEVDGKSVELKRIFYPSRMTIKKLLDEHPEGVIVHLSVGSRSHYIVFSKCLNPEEKTSSKLKFQVYDSAAYSADYGEGVPFEECTSYIVGYRYSNIASVSYFEIID